LNGELKMKTLLMVKPDTVGSGHYGEIISMLLKNRFNITNLRMREFTRDEAEAFYAVHKEREFFPALVDYITSGPVVAIQIEGDDIVQQIRTFIGTTNPADAPPGTIRYVYGTSLQNNAVHASDSTDSSEKELAIVFGDS